MKTNRQKENGSTLIAAVLTLVILSLIGANVLYNCTARYNVASKQVKAWKEAAYAAEAGGDIGFAEVRKAFQASFASPYPTLPTTFLADGWTASGSSYVKGPITFGQGNSLSTTVTIDSVGSTVYVATPPVSSAPSPVACYRVRSTGTAQLFGLPRVGMDDRVNSTTRGDSLVRKIDFKYDHFLATYGDGDGNGKTVQTVANPRITRRIETIAVPQFSTTGALTALGTFNGPGSAGVVDSYDSANGAYYFAANNPADPHYSDSRNGDVAVGTTSFSEGGPIYGNVTTNGGTVTHGGGTNISGTIDNNVPMNIPPVIKPSTIGFTSTNSNTLTIGATNNASPAQYVYNGSANNLSINNSATVTSGPNAGKPLEVWVTIVVNGDIGDLTIAKGVNVKLYFTGTMSNKARDIVNNNVDGATGVYTDVAGTIASTNYSRAGHLQYYGVSPTDGSMGTISIGAPGNFWAYIYAPDYNFNMTGNPDVYGAIVVNNFSGNGNTGFHYDKRLAAELTLPIAYQVASYVEDIR